MQVFADTTRRVYTGHEMLDNVLLVHMNGRVYEPRTGRFVSADPHVDGAATTQGWNRYAYVHGRVLSARDPSGFALEEVIFLFSRWASSGGSGGGAVTVGSASAEPREAEVLIGPDGVETAFVPGTRMQTGGGGGTVPIAPVAPPQWDLLDDLKREVCETGNALQSLADAGYNLGLGLQAGGAPVALIGFAAGGVPAAAPGVAAMGLGGAISWASSGVQTVGGLLQYAGDSMMADANVLAGTASVLTGGAMHFIARSFLRGGVNYVARAHNARMNLSLAFAGAGVDFASSALQGLTPVQANCQ